MQYKYLRVAVDCSLMIFNEEKAIILAEFETWYQAPSPAK